ncbi:MAG: hypothetical protein H6741_10170 [Alphaproteobacteria bacterium]|nr:hypothetical protein [Alphaproteobacteria bacterium]
MASAREDLVTAEDLALFVNACFACTGQSEYYGPAGAQALSLSFLHEYIRGNYRRLYARTLAAGINHHNQGRVIAGLLAAGAPGDPQDRAEEGALIAAALGRLPPQRAWKLLAAVALAGVNNRRARAVARRYALGRRDLRFDAIKYRRHVRVVVRHGHLPLPRSVAEGELHTLLFQGHKARVYKDRLLETWRKARYSEDALYKLPYTVAEGFAARHGVPRERFLKRIQPMMSPGERSRLMRSMGERGVEADVDLARMPLTRLCLYLLSLPLDEREARREALEAALRGAAEGLLRRRPLRLGRVALVLDRSRSSLGSREKRQRPLAVALGAWFLAQAAAREARAFWTTPCEDPLLIEASGNTSLAMPLLDALDWQPGLILIVSDGYENAPPGGADEVARLYHAKLGRRPPILHLNPVFDSERYAPRALGPNIPAFGLRDAEDLPAVLQLARLIAGELRLADVEGWLGECVERLLEPEP